MRRWLLIVLVAVSCAGCGTPISSGRPPNRTAEVPLDMLVMNERVYVLTAMAEVHGYSGGPVALNLYALPLDLRGNPERLGTIRLPGEQVGGSTPSLEAALVSDATAIIPDIVGTYDSTQGTSAFSVTGAARLTLHPLVTSADASGYVSNGADSPMAVTRAPDGTLISWGLRANSTLRWRGLVPEAVTAGTVGYGCRGVKCFWVLQDQRVIRFAASPPDGDDWFVMLPKDTEYGYGPPLASVCTLRAPQVFAGAQRVSFPPSMSISKAHDWPPYLWGQLQLCRDGRGVWFRENNMFRIDPETWALRETPFSLPAYPGGGRPAADYGYVARMLPLGTKTLVAARVSTKYVNVSQCDYTPAFEECPVPYNWFATEIFLLDENDHKVRSHVLP